MLYTKLDELNASIALHKREIKDLKRALNRMENDPAAFFEDELIELYNDHLFDIYGHCVSSLPFTVLQSEFVEFFESCDPTGYRCGFNDWVDNSENYDLMSFDEYSDKLEKLEELEELEDRLSDLESERDDLIAEID